MTRLPGWYREMKSWATAHEDLPDGAFFALAEEMMGWSVEDWAAYCEVQSSDPEVAEWKTQPQAPGTA